MGNFNSISIHNQLVNCELKLCKNRKLTPCPNCKSKTLKKVHILSARLPFWWYIECWKCHWSGRTKLFLFRAIRSWNKEEKRTPKERGGEK